MHVAEREYDDGAFARTILSDMMIAYTKVRSRWIILLSTLSIFLICSTLARYTFMWTAVTNDNPTSKPLKSFSAFNNTPVVDLGYARYEGTARPNGVSQWLGMRYAAPPVGSLRFARPEDPVPMPGLQPAHKVSQPPRAISDSR